MPHYKTASSTTVIPPPPYGYDSPHIIYDEPCYLYDGGYDLKCLATILVRKPGGGTWPKTKIYPQVDMINLVFQTCVCYVNDKVYVDNDTCEIKKYEFPRDSAPITIKTTSMNVKRRLFTITSDEFNVNTISRFLDKDNSPTSVVSSSLTKLSNRVSSSLYFNNPKKIKVNSVIIKDDDKNKK